VAMIVMLKIDILLVIGLACIFAWLFFGGWEMR
jgi:hypothetical protein